MQVQIKAAKEAKLAAQLSPNVSSPVSLLFSDAMTAEDKKLKQACLRQSERSISKGRYKDNDLPGIPRVRLLICRFILNG
jgi:hypothetical protein